MSFDLITKNFVQDSPNLSPQNIVSFTIKTKQNGEIVGIVSTNMGITYIKTITPDGLKINSTIEIPFFTDNRERNRFIVEVLHERYKYTQTDIATFMNMSQSMISNIIKNY